MDTIDTVRKVRRKVLPKFVRKKLQKIRKRWWKKHAGDFAIDDKLACFIAFQGEGYMDNPRGIYEAMLKDERFKDWKYIWFIKKPRKKKIKIEGAMVAGYRSFKYYKYMSRAKVWVINCRMPKDLEKRVGQIYIQTWHGTPLKRLAHDITLDSHRMFNSGKMTYEEMLATYDMDSVKYDAFLSPSPFCTKAFASAFALDENLIKETGYPRNDVLFQDNSEIIAELKEKYEIPEGRKILLYAPTYRDMDFDEGGYTFQLDVNFDEWRKALAPEWFVLFKPHYLLKTDRIDYDSYSDFLRVIPETQGIAQLYPLSDALVTDYSSVMFDYANLQRPIYLYTPDWEEYKKDIRGFYMDIKEKLPGLVFDNERDLLAAVKADKMDYQLIERFNGEFNPYEDGHSSQRVVDLIYDLIQMSNEKSDLNGDEVIH